MLATKALLTVMLGIITFSNELLASNCTGRSIYLNGIDISGSQNQELKKVDVTINENGDIFITAPQYEVYEEDHYLPLSKTPKGLNGPEHRALQQLKHPRDKGFGDSAKLEEMPRSPSSQIPRASTMKELNEKANELTIPPPPNTQADQIPAKIGSKSLGQ